MSDCLHCDINELVQKHLDSPDADVAGLAGRIAESLVDLILSTEPADQAALMADVIGRFGDLYLEKSGTREAGESASRH